MFNKVGSIYRKSAQPNAIDPLVNRQGGFDGGGYDGRKDLLVQFLFLALPPVFFYNVLLVNGTLSPGDGLIQFLPFRGLAAEQWRNLTVPLWNPYIFAGFPLAAEIQTAAFYPPNLVFLFLSPVLAQNLIMSLHYSLAGMFTFTYARTTGLGRWPGFLAGIVFMFSGFLTVHRGHTSMHNAAVWLPLILYFCQRWRDSLNVRYVTYAAFAYCLQILAGDTKAPLLTALLVASYLAYFAFFPTRRTRVFLVGILVLVVGGLLASVQILPTWELANLSIRRNIPYDFFVIGSLPPYVLPTLVFPYLFGAQSPGFYPYAYFGPFNFAELSGYLGILPWAFVAAAMFHMKRDLSIRFWSVIALLALLLAFGRYNPLYKVLYFLPLYNKVRVPARALLLFDFSISMLAGMGLHRLMQLRNNARAAYRTCMRLLLVGLALLCLCVLGFAFNLKAVFAFYEAKSLLVPNSDFLSSARLGNPAVYVPVLVCVLSLASLMFMYLSKNGALSITLLFSVLMLDLFLFVHFSDSAAGYTKYWFSADFQPETVSFLRRAEPDFNQYRVLPAIDLPYATVSETVGALQPNMNMFFKVAITGGYDQLVSERYLQYVLSQPIRVFIGNNRVLSLLNVKYLVASREVAAFIESNRVALPDYRRVYQSGDGLVIYQNLQYQARAFWVGRVRTVGDAESAWKTVVDPLFDPRREVVVTGRVSLAESDRVQAELSGSVNIIEYGNQYIRLETAAQSAGFLVISQTYYPGWHAYIDGIATTVYPADAILSGVFLGEGRHRVEFKFESGPFRLGLAITLTTGLASLLILSFIQRTTIQTERDRIADID